LSYASGNAAVAERIAAAWKLAVDCSHLMAHDKPFIVPVVIDEVSQADARVPERFSELQWTRLPASRHALLRSRARRRNGVGVVCIAHERSSHSLSSSLPAW
jgi:hypothetical protein